MRPGAGVAGGGSGSEQFGEMVGIDIGGTKMLGVCLRLAPGPGGAEPLLAEQMQLQAEIKVPSPRNRQEVAERVEEVLDALMPGRCPRSVGLGVPALVDSAGALRFSAHLPGLVGVAVGEELRRVLAKKGDDGASVPLWVGNDATAAGWAEHRFGAGVGANDMLMVTLGTGIGGGIVARGVLQEGANRFAGEWGHMVVDPHGPRCPCGKQGCWERFASGSGLGLLGRESAQAGQAPALVALAGGDPEAVRGEHVTAAAEAGDQGAAEVMSRFAWWLALGLANLTNIFDPEVVVLGGGLVDAGQVLMVPARKAFYELVEAGEVRGSLRVLPARLGSRAGAIGAALLGALA